jgi:hypothetical protein
MTTSPQEPGERDVDTDPIEPNPPRPDPPNTDEPSVGDETEEPDNPDLHDEPLADALAPLNSAEGFPDPSDRS